MLGKIQGMRRRGQHRMGWLDGLINSVDMSLSKFREMVRTGKPGVLQSVESLTDMAEWLNNNIHNVLLFSSSFWILSLCLLFSTLAIIYLVVILIVFIMADIYSTSWIYIFIKFRNFSSNFSNIFFLPHFISFLSETPITLKLNHLTLSSMTLKFWWFFFPNLFFLVL